MFKDKESSVRSMAVWAIGKYGPSFTFSKSKKGSNLVSVVSTASKKSKSKSKSKNKDSQTQLNHKIYVAVTELLKDKYWKVRTAACISLGCLGPEFITAALPELLSALRSGQINRAICSETIVKMGRDGERILVEILKRMRVKDSVLICPIF